MNNKTREWHNRALEAEAAVEEGIDLVRDLIQEHYLEMREAQANAFQIICQVAIQSATADDLTGVPPSILVQTINRQLETIRDQEDRIDQLEQQLDELREQQTVAREESSDVIRKCNEQLSEMAATAKLRDQQVETLARLWSATFEHRGSPLGPMLTRQLYRVMADHGIDVTDMPGPDTTDCA